MFVTGKEKTSESVLNFLNVVSQTQTVLVASTCCLRIAAEAPRYTIEGSPAKAEPTLSPGSLRTWPPGVQFNPFNTKV